MSRLALTLALARKDWRLFWADRRAAALCFIVPVVLASAFGTIFHRPAAHEAIRPTVLVVVEGSGPFTRQVANELLTSARLDAREATRAEAAAAVAGRKAVAVVLPPDVEGLKDWQPGVAAPRPTLQLLHHPSAAAERQMVEGVVTEAVMKRVTREAFRDVIADDAPVAPPFAIETDRAGHGAQFNSYSHSFCGMTLQYLLLWGMESGLLLLRERQRAVWLRTRAAAVPLACVLAGKALATALVAVLQVAVTFAFGALAFGVRIDGSVLGFGLVALAACALAASVGLVVAAVGGTEARARNVSILVILGVSMVGGLWVPAFLLPQWARDLSLALPTTWALRGFEAVTWQPGNVWAAVPGAAAVGGFALALLAVAAVRLGLAERGSSRGRG